MPMKLTLADQLSEARAVADNEAKERQSLLGKYRNAEHEVAGMKDHYDEEVSAKENVNRQMSKANAEAEMMKLRYEKEGVAKAEEMEMAKLKMQARLSESESTISQLTAKLHQIERTKAKLQSELEGMNQQLDQAQILNNSMEKKAKQFDRIVNEWKLKVDSLGKDLDGSQKETRNASSELFRIKSAYEESVLQLDEVRRENKTLSNEIKDIMDQISEGGRNIHEIDKIRKRLEAEKMELEAALSEAEGALEQEENKVLRAQLELTQVRQEIERRMAEKDEEFDSTRKNMNKAIENMQAAIEREAKGKSEAVRMKKKLETDVLDLDTALEHANAANAETQKVIKKYQLSLRDVQVRLEDAQRAKDVAHDNLIAADRKAHANQNALEEARTMLEQSDRARRMVEQELADTNETLGDQTCTNQAIQGAKMKLESVHFTIKLHLGTLDGLIGASLISKSLIGVSKFLFNHASSTVRLLKHGASLLKSILVGMSLSISCNKIVMSNILGTLSIFKSDLNISKAKLVLLDNLLGFSIGSIGMLKCSVKVQNISFQLLLHSNSLRFSLGLTFNGSLHVFNSFVHVLSG